MRLGQKIRTLRQEKQISIKQLAEKTGLSTGLISQIERDMTGPSVASLWEIAQALNVKMNYFFDEYERPSPIVRKNERKKIILPNSNIIYELLCPDLTKKMEVLLVEIEPGQGNTQDQISHEGEEFGYVLQGILKVKWGSEEYILHEGDSIYYDSSVPHRYINAGDCKTISIWAMTPASF
ncbi:MAG TPA: XRE family transcriptional regulator [Selenomonadales bacterium]|nr:XRE family transcriptional regulator [Selenomonadales bacterium]